MGRHHSQTSSSKQMMDLFKNAYKLGYQIKITKKNTYMLKTKYGSVGTFHVSSKGYHPLRRWMKNNPPLNKIN
tara:strand:- start:78 stop:296 length:219 start_codon:yes stop_codon:yes gene_type:complete